MISQPQTSRAENADFNPLAPAPSPELILFIDAQCPLCMREMHHLKRRDRFARVKLIDVGDAHNMAKHPDIQASDAMQRLHAKTRDGNVLLGLDANVAAWKTVGKGQLLSWLRWPIIRTVADAAYVGFARHRHWFSKWLTGQSRLAQQHTDSQSEKICKNRCTAYPNSNGDGTGANTQ